MEPFAEGLAVSDELDGRWLRRTRARAGLRRPHGIHLRLVGSVCGHRTGSVSGDRVGSVSGDRMGSISGDRVERLICYTESRSTRENLFHFD